MSTTTFRQQVKQMLHANNRPDTPPSKFARTVWYIFKWLVIIEVFSALWYALIYFYPDWFAGWFDEEHQQRLLIWQETEHIVRVRISSANLPRV